MSDRASSNLRAEYEPYVSPSRATRSSSVDESTTHLLEGCALSNVGNGDLDVREVLQPWNTHTPDAHPRPPWNAVARYHRADVGELRHERPPRGRPWMRRINAPRTRGAIYRGPRFCPIRDDQPAENRFGPTAAPRYERSPRQAAGEMRRPPPQVCVSTPRSERSAHAEMPCARSKQAPRPP